MIVDAPSDWGSVLRHHATVVPSFVDLDVGYEIVIPSAHHEIDHVIAHRDKFANAFCPTRAVFEMFSNQTRFVRFMERAHPFWVPRVIAHAPCVWKQDLSSNGSGVALVDTGVIQEAVPGLTEYIWHGAIINGDILLDVTMATELSHPYEIRRGRRDSRIVEPPWNFEQLFRELGYTGFACVNFKMIEDEPRIFEVNPRMGGSLVFSPELPRFLAAVKRALS